MFKLHLVHYSAKQAKILLKTQATDDKHPDKSMKYDFATCHCTSNAIIAIEAIEGMCLISYYYNVCVPFSQWRAT